MAHSELAGASCCSDPCTAAVDTCFVAAEAALPVVPLAFDCNSSTAAAVDSLAVVDPFEPASVALVAVVGLAVAPFAVAAVVVVFGSKLGIVRPRFAAAGFAAASEAAS